MIRLLCHHCNKTIIGNKKHSCERSKCHSCEKLVDLITRKCFFQPAAPQRRKRKKNKSVTMKPEMAPGKEEQTGNPYEEESGSRGIVPLLVFADIESMQEPNLLIAETDKN